MNNFDLTNKAQGYQRSADELSFIMDEMFMSARAFMTMLFEIAAPTDIIIMSGCVVDDSAAPDFTITAGYAYHNGEVFALDAAGFTAGGGETAVFVLETTDVNLTFQDTASYKAREVRKLKLESGVAGSGLKDYGDVTYIKDIFKLSSTGQHIPLDSNQLRFGKARQLILNVPVPASANRTLTLPDPGGNDSAVYAALAQTLSNKTLSQVYQSDGTTHTQILSQSITTNSSSPVTIDVDVKKTNGLFVINIDCMSYTGGSTYFAHYVGRGYLFPSGFGIGVTILTQSGLTVALSYVSASTVRVTITDTVSSTAKAGTARITVTAS